ncbi:MAG: hypothetical protein JO256_10825 [Alphaproteobacteria bacterium]|nr:hypothetical protein [Alphaproteobacteria bacterium]
MSEEAEDRTLCAGAQGEGGPDPASIALSIGSASRERADSFLARQERLTALQIERLEAQDRHFHEEAELQLSNLRWGAFSARMKGALQIMTVLVGLAVVSAAGGMVWSAAHADGLIVESFKVPPDLAAKGLTGDVVATRLLDQLSTMQAHSVSVRAPSSYANNWGDDLKVEIPETGVSLGEINRYLRSRLGHETHISGEVVQLDSGGIEMTVRAGNDTAESVTGDTANVPALVQKAAEAIYARTQPFRYVFNLWAQGRAQEAEALALERTQTGPATERAWAHVVLTDSLVEQNRYEEAIQAARQATVIAPGLAVGWFRLSIWSSNQEERLAAAKKALNLLASAADLLPDSLIQFQNGGKQTIAGILGDYDEAARAALTTFPMIDFSADPATQIRQSRSATGGGFTTPFYTHANIAQYRIRQHDLREARHVLAEEAAYLAALRSSSDALNEIPRQALIERAEQDFRNLEVALALSAEEWARAKQLLLAREAVEARLATSYSGGAYPPVALWPDLALAEAQMGDFAAAHARIDRTPTDCTRCLLDRAQIDNLQKNYGGADFWFAAAVAKFPSIPMPYAEWAISLLQRGQYDDAIAQFTLANRKGPHFADPLEGWGEALMAKNQSHLALAKFAEAEKYAPNWGRLHLKWGEALYYASKHDEAKAQFTRASQLDLTPAEKAELARQSGPQRNRP